MHLGHVGELHQAVRSQNLVRRRLAKPGESPTRNLKCQQTLVTVGDKALRLCVNLGRQLLGPFHIVERQDVGIGGGRSLLEATERHAENRVHAFDNLAQGARVKPNEDFGGIRNGIWR